LPQAAGTPDLFLEAELASHTRSITGSFHGAIKHRSALTM
jgi:hypothetical protein